MREREVTEQAQMKLMRHKATVRHRVSSKSSREGEANVERAKQMADASCSLASRFRLLLDLLAVSVTHLVSTKPVAEPVPQKDPLAAPCSPLLMRELLRRVTPALGAASGVVRSGASAASPSCPLSAPCLTADDAPLRGPVRVEEGARACITERSTVVRQSPCSSQRSRDAARHRGHLSQGEGLLPNLC
jgi:hypothetical protein